MRAQGDTRHPALIEPTRRFLEATSLPWGGMAQCIPPAYAEWIGIQLITHVESRVAA